VPENSNAAISPGKRSAMSKIEENAPQLDNE
jgi:hypothetical protein